MAVGMIPTELSASSERELPLPPSPGRCRGAVTYSWEHPATLEIYSTPNNNLHFNFMI